MSRRPRVLLEGGLYHVYNRFSRGEAILEDPGFAKDAAELDEELSRHALDRLLQGRQ